MVGLWNFPLKCLQYGWAGEFSDYKKRSAINLSFDLLNIHGPSMHPLPMVITIDKVYIIEESYLLIGSSIKNNIKVDGML